MNSLAILPRALPVLGLLLALLLLHALLCPVPAQAQGNNLAQKVELIRQSMDKGQALYLAGKYAAAAQVFEQGYRKNPYSAFLFNAGVCYQKLKDYTKALDKFGEYLTVDPEAPDRSKVETRIAALKAALGSTAAAPADAGAGSPSDAVSAAGPPPTLQADDSKAMKSLVLIETLPTGAPLSLYFRQQDSAGPFQIGRENPGWTKVAERHSPASLTLDVGLYHVVVEKFQEYNESETDIDVSPGHVHHFKANLSQGAFMGFLRVASNVRGAYVFLDDDQAARPPWGNTPHAELVSPGKHTLRLEAPGFEPLTSVVDLKTGEQRELDLELRRLGFGLLRIDSDAPQVEVTLDDKPVGVFRSGGAPLEVKASAGTHRLVVTSDGRKTFEGTVDIPKGQVLPVNAKMIPKYPRGAAWTQAVISAVFLGGAIFLGNESNRLHDELEADRARGVLDEDDSRVALGRWFAIGSNAGFLASGVLGVISFYNFIKDPLPESSTVVRTPVEFPDPRAEPGATSSSARSAFRLAPVVGRNTGAMVVEGRF